MITRRQLLKSAGLLGLALTLPVPFGRRKIQAALLDNVSYKKPSTMPKIIHIFLYGGPSELAGNLTNITEINSNSQNLYPSSLNPEEDNNDITRNNFWGQAGGNIMESLLADKYMSLYRTINRIKDDSKAHGRSVTQNLLGNLDLLNPGIATTLAAILEIYDPFGKSIDELVLPFVSLEGESTVFNLGNLTIPQVMRPVTLDSNFKNPYERSKNWYVDSGDDETNSHKLDMLARSITARYNNKYSKINDAFRKRSELAEFIASRFNLDSVDADLPTDPDSGQPIQYPNSNFGNRLKSAVSLAIGNPDTTFISLGSGGLGGWDDHSDALEDFPSRMNGLMEALQVACRHMYLKDAGNIVINVFGDFGRNVNLNNSMGWDHGNNQNLYTLGGWDIPGRSLGKLVGQTKRIGESKQNRQFTSPTNGSYQCEPFAIASTIFKYFGVQNPQVLTGEPAIDESTDIPNEWI